MIEVQSLPPVRERSNGLIQAARTGDWYAYEQLTLRCEQPAFRLAYLIARDPDTAAELAIRSFLACSATLARTGDSLAFLSGLLQHIIEQARTPRKLPRLGLRAAAERYSQPLSPDVALIRGEQNRLILGGIARLGAGDQTILYLRYFLALDCNEAAVILGCAESQTRTRLRNALGHARTETERCVKPAPGTSAPVPAFEQALEATAASFPYPPTAAIAEEVHRRLDSMRSLQSPVAERRAGRGARAESPRRWPLAAATVLALFLVMLLALLRLR